MVTLCIMLSYGYTIAGTVLQGPVTLKDEVYQSLTIHGGGTLSNITVDTLVVNGSLEAENLVAKKIHVHGAVQAKAITAKSLEVSGPLHIVQSQIDHVSVLGEISIRGLKTKTLYIFTQPSVPMYALRAESVEIKTMEPIELKVGDACYINTIRFTNASGQVYVMKDRSYVGDIINGSLHR